MVKRVLLAVLVLVSGFGVYLSASSARQLSAKVDRVYSLPQTAEKFMSDDEHGQLVRIATSLKYDRNSVQALAGLSLVVFLLSVAALGVELASVLRGISTSTPDHRVQSDAAINGDGGEDG